MAPMRCISHTLASWAFRRLEPQTPQPGNLSSKKSLSTGSAEPKFTVFEGRRPRNPNVGSQSADTNKFCFRSQGWPVLNGAAMTLRASLSVTTTFSDSGRFGEVARADR